MLMSRLAVAAGMPGMMGGMDGGYGATFQQMGGEGAYGGMPQAVPSMAPQVGAAMPPTATHVPGGGARSRAGVGT